MLLVLQDCCWKYRWRECQALAHWGWVLGVLCWQYGTIYVLYHDCSSKRTKGRYIASGKCKRVDWHFFPLARRSSPECSHLSSMYTWKMCSSYTMIPYSISCIIICILGIADCVSGCDNGMPLGIMHCCEAHRSCSFREQPGRKWRAKDIHQFSTWVSFSSLWSR